MATASITVSSKMMAAAQRDIEIVKERGMPLDYRWPRYSPSFNHI